MNNYEARKIEAGLKQAIYAFNDFRLFAKKEGIERDELQDNKTLTVLQLAWNQVYKNLGKSEAYS
ncbi:MAG: hypothetical protein MSC45_05265 [Mobiluncus sp.]|uniref:hypothetical protein n=1 Tax=Mobiluncus sp. TaxID=47293 RepID=UPI002584989F|nr:hypothetical protein [Mobiluncus sp.]MCI6584460.1 hypothetical protein [Mobiluncus sp.]